MCDCLFFSSLALADTYLATIVDKLELNTFVTVVCCLLHIPATQCKLIVKHVLNAEARDFIPVFPLTNRFEAENFS